MWHRKRPSTASILRGGHSNSDNSEYFPRYRRQLVGQAAGNDLSKPLRKVGSELSENSGVFAVMYEPLETCSFLIRIVVMSKGANARNTAKRTTFRGMGLPRLSK